MTRKDWHSQQIKNDKKVYTSLKYIEKLLNSDLLADHMDVGDWYAIRAIAKEVGKMASKYER
jgi:hypothetical protein